MQPLCYFQLNPVHFAVRSLTAVYRFNSLDSAGIGGAAPPLSFRPTPTLPSGPRICVRILWPATYATQVLVFEFIAKISTALCNSLWYPSGIPSQSSNSRDMYKTRFHEVS